MQSFAPSMRRSTMKSFQREATSAKRSPSWTRMWPSKIPMGTPRKVVKNDEVSTHGRIAISENGPGAVPPGHFPSREKLDLDGVRHLAEIGDLVEVHVAVDVLRLC